MLKVSKIQVAICIRGAVSKIDGNFLKKENLYRKSAYVNFVACYNSIIKHIVIPNKNYNFDFFIHCWNLDLKEKLCKIYKPKKYLFEDNNKYIEEIEKKLKDESQFSGVSQSLTIKKSISLLEEYKNQNKKIYNFVILYRPDIILYKNIYLKNYNVFKNIYVNAHPDYNGDLHFVMNYENAILFKYLYDSIEKGNQHKYHFWIKNYIVNYMKKNLLMDDVVPPNDQDVLRKAVEPMRVHQYKNKILFI